MAYKYNPFTDEFDIAGGSTDGLYKLDQSTPQEIVGQIKSKPSSVSQVGQVNKQYVEYLQPVTAPTDLGGCVLWAEAWKETSYTDGAVVGTVTDFSGAGHNGTGTSTARPTYKTNIVNGKAVYRFDGSNDRIDFTGVTIGTIFIVANNTKNSGGTFSGIQGIWQSATTTSQYYIYAPNASTSITFGGSYQAGGYVNDSSSTVFTPFTTFKAITGKLTNPSSNTSWILGRLDNDSKFYGGDVAAVIAFNRVLSLQEMQRVWLYLNAVYNITITPIPIPGTGDFMQYQNYSGTTLVNVDVNGNYTGQNITGKTLSHNKEIISDVDTQTSYAPLTINRKGNFTGIANNIAAIDMNLISGQSIGLTMSNAGVTKGGFYYDASSNYLLMGPSASTDIPFYLGRYAGNQVKFQNGNISQVLNLSMSGAIDMNAYSINNAFRLNMYTGYGNGIFFNTGNLGDSYGPAGWYEGTTNIMKFKNRANRLMVTNSSQHMDEDEGAFISPFNKYGRTGFGVTSADDMIATVHSVSVNACAGTPTPCVGLTTGNCTGTRNCGSYGDESSCSTHGCSPQMNGCSGNWEADYCGSYSFDEGTCNSVAGCYWDGASCYNLCAYFNNNESGCNSHPACQWDGIWQCSFKANNCSGYNGDSVGCTDAHCSYGGFSGCSGDGGNCPSYSNLGDCTTAYGGSVCSWVHDQCNNQDGCSWSGQNCNSWNNNSSECTTHTGCSFTSDGPCSNWNGNSGQCSAEGCSYNDCSTWNNTDQGICESGHNGCHWDTVSCTGMDQTSCESTMGCGWNGNCGDFSGSGESACNAVTACSWNYSNCSDYNNMYGSCTGTGGCSWSGSDCSMYGDEGSCTMDMGCGWHAGTFGSCTGATGCETYMSTSDCQSDPLAFGGCSVNWAFSFCDGSSGCENYSNESDCQSDPNMYGGCTTHYDIPYCSGTSQVYGSCNGRYNEYCSGTYCTGSYATGNCSGSTCDGTSIGGICSGETGSCSGTPTNCATYITEETCGEQLGCSWDLLDAYHADGTYNTTKGYKFKEAITDSEAENDMYFKGSNHSNKLCFKDENGVVHVLY